MTAPSTSKVMTRNDKVRMIVLSKDAEETNIGMDSSFGHPIHVGKNSGFSCELSGRANAHAGCASVPCFQASTAGLGLKRVVWRIAACRGGLR